MPAPCCISYRLATRIIGVYHIVMNALLGGFLFVVLVFLAVGFHGGEVHNNKVMDLDGYNNSSGEIVDSTTDNYVANFVGNDDKGHRIVATDDFAILDGKRAYLNLDYVMAIVHATGDLYCVMTVLVVTFFMALVFMILSYELYRGATMYNWSRCKGWLYAKIALVIAGALMIPIKFIVYGKGDEDLIALSLGTLLGSLVEFYVLWIVASFIQETKKANGNAGTCYTKA